MLPGRAESIPRYALENVKVPLTFAACNLVFIVSIGNITPSVAAPAVAPASRLLSSAFVIGWYAGNFYIQSAKHLEGRIVSTCS
jgi:hypothetical protein